MPDLALKLRAGIQPHQLRATLHDPHERQHGRDVAVLGRWHQRLRQTVQPFEFQIPEPLRQSPLGAVELPEFSLYIVKGRPFIHTELLSTAPL